MPERFWRKRRQRTLLTEIVGSGPYRYLPDQRVPGARNVYAKFDAYPNREPVSAKLLRRPTHCAHFDRVEWLTTQTPPPRLAALQRGEVDWVEANP